LTELTSQSQSSCHGRVPVPALVLEAELDPELEVQFDADPTQDHDPVADRAPEVEVSHPCRTENVM